VNIDTPHYAMPYFENKLFLAITCNIFYYIIGQSPVQQDVFEKERSMGKYVKTEPY